MSSDATLIPDLVLEYRNGGDLLDFIIAHNWSSEALSHIKCAGLFRYAPTLMCSYFRHRNHTLTGCTTRVSPAAVSSLRYAVSADFAPQTPQTDPFPIPQNVLPTKDDSPIVKVCRWSSRQGRRQFPHAQGVSVCLFCLFVEGTISVFE